MQDIHPESCHRYLGEPVVRYLLANSIIPHIHCSARFSETQQRVEMLYKSLASKTAHSCELSEKVQIHRSQRHTLAAWEMKDSIPEKENLACYLYKDN